MLQWAMQRAILEISAARV